MSPDVVFGVLTDYANLPTVFQTISSCSTPQHLDGQLQMAQTCKWQFLGVFKGEFVISLAVDENPNDLQLSFSLLDSGFMKDFVGSWEVSGESSGSCTIRYSLTVSPTIAPPPYIAQLTKKIFAHQVSGVLADLQKELQRQQQYSVQKRKRVVE
jgi:hypothetical protein